MRLTLKTKIWMAVVSVVMMFAFFILFYFPAQQEKFLLKNYNKEVQNLANTVALGVKIALTEQNFEGVQTAIDFVRNDSHLKYVSLVQVDTSWNATHTSFQLTKTVFKTFPEEIKPDVFLLSNDTILVKHAAFNAPVMNGEILLAFTTDEIIQSKKQIRLTSIIVSLIVFLIGIVIGFWLAKNISVPVLELRDAANRVGEGDLTQRVKNRSRDEIGELGLAFNKMVTDLAIAREQVRSTQEQLIHAEKMASLGQLTAGIAHEIQNPLNFVNNFSEICQELMEELEHAKTDEEKKDITGTLKGNLNKIVTHGKGADRIVKAMLMHSREKKGGHVATDINELLIGDISIAFHGTRKKYHDLKCELVTSYDNDAGYVNVVPQDISQVVINLLNNAFYAVRAKMIAMQKEDDDTFHPIVKLSTVRVQGKVIVRIEDNGSGIPDDVKDKIFNPFFTTKPPGEGTGLGLSLSYDLIKANNGKLILHSSNSNGTVFEIHLQD